MAQIEQNASAAGEFGPEVLRMPETRQRYSGPAMRAFVRMMDKWEVTIADRCAVLGGIPKTTYHNWARGNVATLSRDQLERIGITLGIHKALELLFVDEGGRMGWFKSPNHDYAFRGQSPAGRMADGGITDLYAVREYLDGMRGGR